MASVIERDGEFTRGGHPHNHDPDKGVYQRLIMGKMVSALREVEFKFIALRPYFFYSMVYRAADYFFSKLK